MSTPSVIASCLAGAVVLFGISTAFNPVKEAAGTAKYKVGRAIQLLALVPIGLLFQHLYPVIAGAIERLMAGNYVRGGEHHAGTLFAVLAALLLPTFIEFVLMGSALRGLQDFGQDLGMSHGPALGFAAVAVLTVKGAAYWIGNAASIENSLFWPVLPALGISNSLPYIYLGGFMWYWHVMGRKG